MRTDNWELNEIANKNIGGGGREVLDQTLNNSFRELNQQVDQDLDERESQMAAERENEENEVTQDKPEIKIEECSCTRLIVDRSLPPRCISYFHATSLARARALQYLLRWLFKSIVKCHIILLHTPALQTR